MFEILTVVPVAVLLLSCGSWSLGYAMGTLEYWAALVVTPVRVSVWMVHGTTLGVYSWTMID